MNLVICPNKETKTQKKLRSLPVRSVTLVTLFFPGSAFYPHDLSLRCFGFQTLCSLPHLFCFLHWFKQASLVEEYCGNSSVQSLSRVRLSVTPWTAARRASLSITNSWSLLKLMSIELVVPSNHLILCWPLLLPPSIFPSIRVFSNESVLRIRWPKYWSFSFRISPSSEYSGVISSRIDWFDLLAVQGTLKSSPIPQFKSISSLVCSFLYSPTLTFTHDYKKNYSFY